MHKPLGLSPLPGGHMQHLVGGTSDPVIRPPVSGSGAACRAESLPGTWQDQGCSESLPSRGRRGPGGQWPGRAEYHVILCGKRSRQSRRDPSTVMACQAETASFSDDFANRQMKQKLLIIKKYRWLPLGLFVSVSVSSAGHWLPGSA